MKAKEIRELSDSEIDRRITDLKDELFNLRFQGATGQLENPMRVRQVKKDIARLKTVQRTRELAAGVDG
ncbi:MAG: 50S ribosomal protein L29 [Clostridia bacterium]